MTVEQLRAIPGRVGLWSIGLRPAGRPEVVDAASELDGLGFRVLWIPGLDGTGVFEDLEQLLQAASHSTVALGVLGIWGHHPAEVGQRFGDISKGGHVDFTQFILGTLSAHRSSTAARSARLVTAPTIPSGAPVV